MKEGLAPSRDTQQGDLNRIAERAGGGGGCLEALDPSFCKRTAAISACKVKIKRQEKRHDCDVLVVER